MKTCSTCGTSYSDELSFCLQDGTRLSDQTSPDLTNRPTEILQRETNENTDISAAETVVSESNKMAPVRPTAIHMSAVEPATRMGCALTIGQVAAGLLVVVGLGIVGILYTSRQNNVAMLENTAANSPPLSLSNAANTSANSASPMAGQGGYQPANTTAANVATNASSTPQISATKATPAPTAVTTTSTPYPPPITSSDTPQPTLLPGRTPRRVAGGVLNGRAISLPQPPYPPVARAAGASGPVRVQVLVDESGNVIAARAMNGHPLLQNAAERAARSARFSPTLLGGQPVKVSGVIVYNFVR